MCFSYALSKRLFLPFLCVFLPVTKVHNFGKELKAAHKQYLQVFFLKKNVDKLTKTNETFIKLVKI